MQADGAAILEITDNPAVTYTEDVTIAQANLTLRTAAGTPISTIVSGAPNSVLDVGFGVDGGLVVSAAGVQLQDLILATSMVDPDYVTLSTEPTGSVTCTNVNISAAAYTIGNVGGMVLDSCTVGGGLFGATVYQVNQMTIQNGTTVAGSINVSDPLAATYTIVEADFLGLGAGAVVTTIDGSAVSGSTDTISVGAGTVLNVNNASTISGFTGAGITNTSGTVTVDGSLIDGGSAGQYGIVSRGDTTLQNGAVIQDVTINGLDHDTGTVNVDNSTIQNSAGTANLLTYGGTVNIVNGSQLLNPTGRNMWQASAPATTTITGSTLTGGVQGIEITTGSLLINGGSQISGATDASIQAVNANSGLTITVDGATTVIDGGNFNIVSNNNAAVSVTGGATLQNALINGVNQLGAGTLTVDASTISGAAANGIYVANGTVNIVNGATITGFGYAGINGIYSDAGTTLATSDPATVVNVNASSINTGAIGIGVVGDVNVAASTLSGLGLGLYGVAGTIDVTAGSNVAAAGNGILLFSPAFGPTTATVDASTISSSTDIAIAALASTLNVQNNSLVDGFNHGIQAANDSVVNILSGSTVTADVHNCVDVSGTANVTLNASTINAQSAAWAGAYLQGGTLTVENGSVIQGFNDRGVWVVNVPGSTLNVDGSTISGGTNGIIGDINATANITGGSVISGQTFQGAAANNGFVLNLDGSTIDGTSTASYGAIVRAGGAINLTNGAIIEDNTVSGIDIDGATSAISVNGSTIQNNAFSGIYAYKGGIDIQTGSLLSGNGVGINRVNDGATTITAATLTNLDTNVLATSGTLSIASSTLSAASTAGVNIGGNVASSSIESTSVSGSFYGIVNDLGAGVTLDITNGSTVDACTWAIENRGAGTTNIANATISNCNPGGAVNATNVSTGVVNVSDTTMTDNDGGVVVFAGSTATVNVTNGSIASVGSGIIAEGGTVDIDGTTITGAVGIDVNGGNVTGSTGTVTATGNQGLLLRAGSSNLSVAALDGVSTHGLVCQGGTHVISDATIQNTKDAAVIQDVAPSSLTLNDVIIDGGNSLKGNATLNCNAGDLIVNGGSVEGLGFYNTFVWGANANAAFNGVTFGDSAGESILINLGAQATLDSCTLTNTLAPAFNVRDGYTTATACVINTVGLVGYGFATAGTEPTLSLVDSTVTVPWLARFSLGDGGATDVIDTLKVNGGTITRVTSVDNDMISFDSAGNAVMDFDNVDINLISLPGSVFIYHHQGKLNAEFDHTTFRRTDVADQFNDIILADGDAASTLNFDQCDFVHDANNTGIWMQENYGGSVEVRDSIIYNAGFFNQSTASGTVTHQSNLLFGTGGFVDGTDNGGSVADNPLYASTTFGSPTYLMLQSASPGLTFNSGDGPETYVGAKGEFIAPNAVQHWSIFN